MPTIVDRKTGRVFTMLLVGSLIVTSACAPLSETAYVQEPDIPEYRTAAHRIEEPVDLYIEPRIPVLVSTVEPRSDTEVFPAVSIVAGPALETALLALTRQHFSRATQVTAPGGRPTLRYELLTYKPVVTVVPGALRKQLIVSARLAIQVTMQSAKGENLFSATAIGTSHVSDTKLSPGNSLKGSGQLVETVTRNAIIDAMYEISRIFGNSGESIGNDVRSSEVGAGLAIESFDDVVFYLRTLSVEPT